MTPSSADLEAEVEASRSELDRNMEALKQKMTPGQLFDEAARAMGGTGQQVASKFMEQAKANPMPLAVMGMGLAWLMMSNQKSGSGVSVDTYAEPRSFAGGQGDATGSSGLTDKISDAASGIGDKAHSLGDKAKDLLGGAQDKVAGIGSSAAGAGRSAVHSVGAAASTAKDKAGQIGQQAQRTVMDMLESEPLLIAGIGLVVGAAIGAALPHTDAEDHLMGQARDKLLTKGKDIAQSGLQQASSVAQAAYGSVKSELQDGGDDRDLSERVGEAVKSGVQAGRDELHGSAH
jgi:hypothetical protein